MRIASLLFASAAIADTNSEQLTKKVRIARFSSKMYFYRQNFEKKMIRLEKLICFN